MKAFPKTILALSLFTLCACAGNKTPDSSNSSGNASSSSGTATSGENVNDTFVKEERIDITSDFDSQA